VRTLGLLVLTSLTAAATADGFRWYLVVPTGHPIDGGMRPCAASLSADGASLAFDAHVSLDPADQNGRSDVYVLDRATSQVTLVSRNRAGRTGRGSSRCARVSGDGHRVVFESDVPDLVEGDTPGTVDVFVFDRASGSLRRIAPTTSAGPTMSAAPAVSTDGRVVVFDASAIGGTLVERRRVYRATVDDGAIEDVGVGHSATVSGDGRVVAFVTSVSPGQSQVIRVVGSQGVRTLGKPDPGATDLAASTPVLSADGQWIAYVLRSRSTGAGRSAPGRSQVFVEHVETGVRHLVSASPRGREANGYSVRPAIDATGTRVAFESTATDLGCGCHPDINMLSDIFVWDRTTTTVTRVNVATRELGWLEGAAHPTISADGTTVAFLSRQPVSDADGRDTFELFVTPR
jgi:Tol biopolymer transport system component